MDAELFYVIVGAVAVAGFARWRGWPAPLLVTVVALAVSLIPFVPDVAIDGHVLLNLVLPPLLYSAALDVTFTGFRRALPHIRRLGIGLVIVTAVVVGLLAWLVVPDLGLAGALLLGAIAGPPDAVSAAAVGRKLGLPRRVMTVLSGESLINDATSLTLVRVFAAVVAGATVTVWSGIGQFVLAVVVGVVVGLAFGGALHLLRMRFDDPVVNGTVGLLVPFGAYAIAEHLGGSGVLAVVAMGLYVGYNAPRTSYAVRQQERPLWLSADFLLESFVFAYIGLQFPRVLQEMGTGSAEELLLVTGIVFLAVLLVRPAFVFAAYAWGQLLQRLRLRRWKHVIESAHGNPGGWRARGLRRRKQRIERRGRRADTQQIKQVLTEPRLSVSERVVVSWAGMRGVVTLATAAAVPDLTGGAMSAGAANTILVVAFAVTVGTLLLQGLTLAPLIRWLGVNAAEQHASDARQLAAMRKRSQEAGKEFLRRTRAEWAENFGADAVVAFDRVARSLLRIERDSGRAEQALEGASEQDAGGTDASERAAGADPSASAEGAEPGVVREAGDQARRGEITGPLAAFKGAIRYEDLLALSKGWLRVRRRVLLEERDRGNLSEEVMRELITAMDAEELALDTRGSIRPSDRV